MSNKACPGMMLYFDDLDAMSALEDAQLGRLARLMAAYAQGNAVEPPPDDPMLTIAFSMLRVKLDRDRDRYDEVCARRSEAARKSHRPQSGQTEQM